MKKMFESGFLILHFCQILAHYEMNHINIFLLENTYDILNFSILYRIVVLLSSLTGEY